jgi:hypothetical protein
MLERHHISFFGFRVGRFIFLFISIVLYFTLKPFLEGLVGIKILMDIFLSFLFVSGAYAVSRTRTTLIVAWGLAIPTIVTAWLIAFMQKTSLILAQHGLGAIFFIYITILVLGYLFRAREIELDIVFAGVCVYFMIGIIWAYAFSMLEILEPGSFQIPEGLGADLSFVTLTTLGYGDITPISAEARSLSLLEATVGQIYLAVLVAGLVGVYISQSIKGVNK